MTPMFVILWHVGLYAHNLASTKIHLNSLARSQAWDYAMANCDQGQGDSPTTPADWGATESPGPLKPVPGNPPPQPTSPGGKGAPNTSVMSKISGLLGSMFTNPEGSQSIQNGSVSFRVPNLYDKSGMSPTAVPLGATVVVFCNEEAQNGSFSEVIGMIFSLLFNFG